MAIATGIAKRVAYKKESSYGVLPGATSAQIIRRTESSLALSKDTYESGEIRSDYQMADYRHGVRRIGGNLNGELSLGTYADFWAAGLRAAWVAGISGSQTDFTSVTTTTSTIVAASGSFITKGFRVGDVVRCTGLPDAANNSKNLRITGLTATVMTVAETLVANATADTSFTIAVVGKKVMVPLTGHTDDSFTIEHYHQDVGTVEVFTGNKINTMEVSLPATGMATLNMALVGQDMLDDPNGNTTVPYFTSPTAPTTTQILTAVQGKLRLAGADIVTVTGVTLNISGNLTGDPVVGSDVIPQQAVGRVLVSGQFTAYYTGGSLTTAFKNETELSLHFMLTGAGSAPQDFLSFHLPRIKLGGTSKNDGEGQLIQTVPFQALLMPTTTGFDSTTICIQDSTLV